MASKGKYGQINDLPGFKSREPLIYYKWSNMFKRVYDPLVHITHPSYIGCTVEPSWFYLSNFVKDFEQLPGYNQWLQLKGKGMSLDKDILVPGNKHYGPNTCTLMLMSDNISDRNVRNNKGRKVKRILGTNLKDGSTVEFNSLNEAALAGFSSPAISMCLGGKRNKHKDYVWREL